MKTLKYLISTLIIIILFQQNINAQFYNGHQMTFGKNRVQYNEEYKMFYRYDKYDTYFYAGGKEFAKVVAKIAEKKITELENFFGYGLQKRVIFLCYNKLSDFRESNIGYDSGNEQTNIGGVTRIIDNKIFIYNEGDYKKLEKQITSSLVEVIINEILYGGSFRQKLTNSTLISLPDWYKSGLISYITEEWSIETENLVKDGFENNLYRKINHLRGDEARVAGHSIWYFIAETYGKDVIPGILYITKVNKNPDSGFMYVLGSSIKDLTPVWKDFYAQMIEKSAAETTKPDEEKKIKKGKPNSVLQQVKISPDGKKLAYVVNLQGRFKIYIYDFATGKKKLIKVQGHKLDQITDYSYPVLCWHPTGKILSYIIENQGSIVLNNYFIETKKTQIRNLMYFQKVLSFDYSDNGYYITLSAIMNGQTDVFVFSVAAGTIQKVTDDNADDFNPTFVNNSKNIVFSSNRISDSLIYDSKILVEIQENQDLFMFDYDKKQHTNLIRLTNTPLDNETVPVGIKNNTFLSLTDENGIINRQIISYDSTISYIDTTIHYRNFINNKRITNYSKNVYDFDYNSNTKGLSEIIFSKKRFNIFKDQVDENSQSIQSEYKTDFKKKLNNRKQTSDSLQIIQIETEKNKILLIDSLRKNPPRNIVHPDSSLIDINNFLFEKEKKLDYYKIFEIKQDSTQKITEKEDSTIFIQTNNYLTTFYTDYLVQQVDFGFLNNSYQYFTGGAFYFNPGFNIFMKVGVYDLFEDYKISGGVRIGGNLGSYEYIISLENLKKRIDKQYIYHRQTFEQVYSDSQGYPYTGKFYTNEVMYLMKYPFNQVTAAKITFSLRHDKGEILSVDYPTLTAKGVHQFFSGVKGEYIFDNTRDLGANLYDGIRFKVFGEFYQEVDQKYTNLAVVGLDFRFYKKLHRTLIFASRFASSSSFGKSKLIYYLGGVDNWYTFSPDKIMFDKSVAINYSQNYVYQAVATNMRGFVQNARNGTNFFVMNNELRFPIIKYFANRPLNSAFFNNFQVVGFADIGSAWSGISPYSKENAYMTETIKTGSVTVIIDKERAPVVFGYGFGVRSKLLGYFVRLDWAWGIEHDVIMPRIFYFSLNLDF